MNKTIGIMGCGWLGLPLAKELIKEGYTVSGTTTAEDKLPVLKQAGIYPFKLALGDTEIKGPINKFLNSCEILIINVPPKLRGAGPKASYIDKMQVLLKHIKNSTVQKVIFVSSTSVYSDAQGNVTENTLPQPTSEAGKQLVESEHLFTKQTNFKTTIVRFGGLIGPDRHPVTMLARKEFLTDGTAPVNLIHLNDCIRILTAILKENKWGETFNAVHPDHPKKQEYYAEKAKNQGLEFPYYTISEDKIYKKIDSCKLFLTNANGRFTSL